MTVDDFHTYFISKLNVWVHNTNCTPDGIVNWTDQRKGMNSAPVTVYYHKNGGYVARRNDTGEIIQASDVNDPNWSNYWSPSDSKWKK